MPTNRLRELRQESGLSMRELGKIVGFDQSTISRWERNLVPGGIPDNVKVHLAEYFGVSVPFLMGWDKNGNNGNGAEEVAA